MAQQMIAQRRFVYCEIPTEPTENLEDEYPAEPPLAKKLRGANAKHVFYGVADSLEELKQKAKEAGLFCKEARNGRAYFQCRKCSYRWKCHLTTDSNWIIDRTEEPNDHEHADVNRKNGMANEFKEIAKKRIVGRERTNAGAVLTQFRTDLPGVPKPTTDQVRSFVKYEKKKMNITGDICFAKVQKMVQTEILPDRSDLLEFKYLINDDPSKTDFVMIYTCKKLLDEQRSQKHSQFDATFKLIFNNFPVVIWGYSDKNRHIHPTGVAIISSESKNVYKWIFEFLKSNRFCEGEWIPIIQLVLFVNIANMFSLSNASVVENGQILRYCVKQSNKLKEMDLEENVDILEH